MFVHLFFKDGRHNLTELFSFFFRKVPLTFRHGIEFRVLLGYTLNCLGRRMPSDKERNAFDPFLRYKSQQLLTCFFIRNLSCAQSLLDLFLFLFCKIFSFHLKLLILLFCLSKSTLYTYVVKTTTKGTEK